MEETKRKSKIPILIFIVSIATILAFIFFEKRNDKSDFIAPKNHLKFDKEPSFKKKVESQKDKTKASKKIK